MAMRLSGANANVEQYSSITNEGLSSAAEDAGKGNAARQNSPAASNSAAGAPANPPNFAASATRKLSFTDAVPFSRGDCRLFDFRMRRVRRAGCRIHLAG